MHMRDKVLVLMEVHCIFVEVNSRIEVMVTLVCITILFHHSVVVKEIGCAVDSTIVVLLRLVVID